MNDQPKLNIRWMIKRDFPDVLRFERYYGKIIDGFEPWTDEDLTSHLRRRDTIGVVYDPLSHASDPISAYMIYRLGKESLEIIRFATDPALRRTGLMTVMLQRAIDKLDQQRRHRIICYVSEQNLAAQLTLSKIGFRGECRGDEIRFVYRLGGKRSV